MLDLGEVIMGAAVGRLDEDVRTAYCAHCGGTVQQRKRPRRIATLVGEVTFQQSRGNGQACGAGVSWVDRELGIDAYQRSSPGLEALKAWCAVSWGLRGVRTW